MTGPVAPAVMSSEDAPADSERARARLRPVHWVALAVLLAANAAAAAWALGLALDRPAPTTTPGAFAGFAGAYDEPGLRNHVRTETFPGEPGGVLERDGFRVFPSRAEADAAFDRKVRQVAGMGLTLLENPPATSAGARQALLGDLAPGQRQAVVRVEPVGDDWRVRLTTREPSPRP
ncbi:MAG: hypothetical protein AAF612_11715 [Planctomycetota bacterium]